MKKALISVGILLSIVTKQLRLRLRPKRAVLVYWCNVVWWNRAIQQWEPYGEYQSCGSRQRPLQYMILQAIINNRGDLKYSVLQLQAFPKRKMLLPCRSNLITFTPKKG